MTPLIEKYISTERVHDIGRENNFDETTLQQFIQYLDEALREEEAICEQREIEEKLPLIIGDGLLFIDERKKGFSEGWATIYVKMLNDHNHNPAALTFWELMPLNEQEALQNLGLYCDLTMKDEIYRKYFEDLIINMGEVLNNIEDKAALYSKTYRAQISGGHSELFADKYVDLKAQEWTDVGCFAYAAEYEKAVLSGFSEEYAEKFAKNIADYIANHFYTYDQSIDDELVNLEKQKLEKMCHHLK